MIMLGLEFTGDVPFRQVYIHGLVRDQDKQKMSKSKGNAIDPLLTTEKYGTDATRMALLTAAAPGNDIVFSDDRPESARAFANKIWNAARFVFFHMERSQVPVWAPFDPATYVPEGNNLEDRWLFSRLNAAAEQMNRAIENHRYHEAAQTIWHYFWGEFCDWYLEMKKLRFEEASGLNSDWRNLLAAFEASLRLLHPVMPFITEELWQRLGTGGKSIALAAYPQYNQDLTDLAAEHEMQLLQDIVAAARNLRSEMKVDPKLLIEGTLYSTGPALRLAVPHTDAIRKLANVNLSISDGHAPVGTEAVRTSAEFDLVLTLPEAQAGLQTVRFEKEIIQLRQAITNTEKQLNDDTFRSKAPSKIIDGMQTKLDGYRAQLTKVQAALASK